MSGPGPSCGERSEEGFTVLTLDGGGAEAIEVGYVPAAGMVACSLRHRGEELLGTRQGLRAYAEQGRTMGIPLLYPWANRLSRPAFELEGRRVDLGRAGPRVHPDENGLPIHGLLAGDPAWRVSEHAVEGDAAVLAADYELADGPLVDAFPFPHTLRLEARVRGSTLTVGVAVEADRGSPVPVSFGFHPYLRLPAVERERWEITAPVGRALVLDDRGIPTGQRHAAPIEPGSLGERTFDDAYLAPAPGDAFTLSGGGRTVRVALEEGYPFTQVYAPADDAVICFEPMTAPTDALVRGGAELEVLEPGAAYEASFSISAS